MIRYPNRGLLCCLHSDIGQDVGADRVEELGQVHDEHTVGVQARTGVETSQRTGHALDTRQRPEVQVSEDQARKVTNYSISKRYYSLRIAANSA